MIVSSRHFLKPEDLSFIEIILFKGNALSCGCFFYSRKNSFCISLKFKLLRWASPYRMFWPNGVNMSLCSRVCNGLMVNGVP